MAIISALLGITTTVEIFGNVETLFGATQLTVPGTIATFLIAKVQEVNYVV